MDPATEWSGTPLHRALRLFEARLCGDVTLPDGRARGVSSNALTIVLPDYPMQDQTLTLRLMDRLQGQQAGTTGLLHGGVVVTMAETTNTNEYRDQAVASVVDQLAVTLAFQIKPQTQRLSRDMAIYAEECIRRHLCDYRWTVGRDLNIQFVSAVRGLSNTSAEWWASTQTFRIRRDAAL